MTQEERAKVIEGLTILMRDSYNRAHTKGFWQLPASLMDLCEREPEVQKLVEGLQKAQKVMLVVSEHGEYLEGVRKPGPSDKIGGYSQEEEEWADGIIRDLDRGMGFGYRLSAILAKSDYNELRPAKHGKGF